MRTEKRFDDQLGGQIAGNPNRASQKRRSMKARQKRQRRARFPFSSPSLHRENAPRVRQRAWKRTESSAAMRMRLVFVRARLRAACRPSSDINRETSPAWRGREMKFAGGLVKRSGRRARHGQPRVDTREPMREPTRYRQVTHTWLTATRLAGEKFNRRVRLQCRTHRGILSSFNLKRRHIPPRMRIRRAPGG